jgi:hypothetical protein
MASLIPKWVKKEIVDAWVAEDWWLMLLNSTHAPNASTQQYVSDVVANEITDTGLIYTAGGVAISGKASLAQTNNYSLDASDVVIGPGATLTYRYGILYTKTGGTSQASYKIRAQIDFVTDQITTNGTSTIVWNTLGIITIG